MYVKCICAYEIKWVEVCVCEWGRCARKPTFYIRSYASKSIPISNGKIISGLPALYRCAASNNYLGLGHIIATTWPTVMVMYSFISKC